MASLGNPGIPESDSAAVETSFESTYAATVNLLEFIARVRFRIPSTDTDALVQDVYLKFARDFAQVRTPRSWLVAALSNACRNYWRDRREEEPYPDEVEGWEDPASARAIDSMMTRLALGAALRQIGERCRELLHRFHLDGESTEMLAQERGTTAGYIQVLLHQCRKKTRTIYTELTQVRS
jgi:RNA polymerase sigma factor (sigma-70 family)